MERYKTTITGQKVDILDYVSCRFLIGNIIDPIIQDFCKRNKGILRCSIRLGDSQWVSLQNLRMGQVLRLKKQLEETFEVTSFTGPIVISNPPSIDFYISIKVFKGEDDVLPEPSPLFSSDMIELETKKEKNIKHQRSLEIAKKMKQGNIPYDQIQKFTELTIVEIKRL